MSRTIRLLVLLALSVALVACGGDDDDDDGGAAAEAGVVVVDDNVFKPKAITVEVGDTVTWRFEGDSAHNVTFDDFNSDLEKSGTFEHTFDEAGELDYTCTVHPGMDGTVTVEDAA